MSEPLSPELMDDFYSECDEHLGNFRSQLSALETSVETGRQDPAALESLYRSVHSLKGNVAIVGLAEAERLAHSAEDLLRALTRGEAPVTADRLDLIGQAGHRLEQMVAAFRLGQPIPTGGDALRALQAFQEGETHAAASFPVPSPLHAAPARTLPGPAAPGKQLWRALFSPSAALDARGVNVNAVRARLLGLGEIQRATPTISPGGKMVFEFVVALREKPAHPAAWQDDGIVLEAVEASPAADTNTQAADEGSLFVAPSHIIRVDLGRLDDLMRIVGEMVIHRSRLEERIARLGEEGGELREVSLGLGRSLRELREAITRVRMVPVAEIFSRLPFVVRDLGRDGGKQVRLALEGHDTEIDKYLVERLKEPFLHLVRNAISHGIETPAERRAAGKPEEATILLRAATVGDSVVIQIRDDGAGVNIERVARRAAEAGLALPEAPDAVQLLGVLCAPGFSTRDAADRASGRGVGMAVVANTVRELGGSLSLETVPGRSTQFTLRLPLTLSIAETLVFSANEQIFAVAQGMVEEIILIQAREIRAIEGTEVAPYRAGVLPLVRLRALVGAAPSPRPELPVLVLATERGLTGLVVDRLLGQREVVVRPMKDPLLRVPGIAGATELGDGKPVLILDAAVLSAGAIRPHSAVLAPDAPSSDRKAS